MGGEGEAGTVLAARLTADDFLLADSNGAGNGTFLYYCTLSSWSRTAIPVPGSRLT